MRSPNKRLRVLLAVLFVAGFGLSTPAAYADDDDLRGVITARGKDGTVMVRADDSSMVVVVLDDETKVTRTDGLRNVTLSWAALIPGLRVEVEGVYLTANRFAAERVSFSRSDMKMAFAIHGGIDPIDQQRLENQRRIDQNVRTLEQQRQILQRQEQEIAANEDKIQKASAALAALLQNKGISDNSPANRGGTTVERVDPPTR